MTMRLGTLAVVVLLAAACSSQREGAVRGEPRGELEDLPEMGGLDHAWVDPGTSLKSYGTVWVDPPQSHAESMETRLMESLPGDFDRAFRAVGKKIGHGGLRVSPSVYMVDRANAGRAFIPYAGAVMWQAAVGLDVIVTDERSGKVVAKMRHEERRGTDPVAVGSEVVDDVVGFVASH